ncbi:MAG: hypothetical protein EP329_14240 [Deltaproteobacteria bacterium]|nr:MAG: hypothetical protein EP329_14240 [Deltaproteobacteria bacterium]
MLRALACLAPLAALATLLAAPAAGARSPGVAQGTWIGTEEGLRAGTVTVFVHGDRLVLADAVEVLVARATWKPHGPGTKDGRLTMRVDLDVQGLFAADGKPTKRLRGRGKRLGTAVVGDDTMRLCWAESADEKQRPKASRGAEEWSKSTLCLDLTLVASGAAPPSIRPRPTPPPDGSALNPPPRIQPAGEECMRECRQHNMARAVAPEVIDADCRKSCGLE